jgi:cell wall-associated NlpC family hydrolase
MSWLLETAAELDPITPQPGDFTCMRISGDVGEMIRVGQWMCGDGFRNFEHAEILVNGTQTFGAYPGGADVVTLPEDQSGWLWSSGAVKLTDAQRVKIVEAALALKGTPYSALDYFAIAARRLRIPDPDHELQDFIGDSKSMICSQLVDYCYLQAGVHLFNDGRWPGYVTPADLANVIMHPESVTYGRPRNVKPPMRTP